MKQIMLTGATSSVGIALIEECLKHNIQVFALVRKNSKNIFRLPNSNLIEIVEADLKNLLNIESFNFKSKIDAFYHFGWENTDRLYRNDVRRQMNNIKYTMDALELCDRLNCKTFIGAGSQAEYGRSEKLINSVMTAKPETAYGISKYTAGLLAQNICNQRNIRFVWGRIFSAFGIYDNMNTMIMYAISNMLNDRITEFTKSEQMWDYIYLKDVGKAFYLLGEKTKAKGFYCIGSGKAKPLHEYIEIIYKMTKAKLPIGIGKKEYSSNQVMYLCADISKLIRDTGFLLDYTFEEGIKETIDWYKREVNIK